MLLAEIARAVDEVTATPSRTAKVRRLADTLLAADPDEVAVVVRYLSGEVRQRRTGIGWRSLTAAPPPASEPTVTVLDLDAALEQAQAAAGPGSVTRRREIVQDLMSRATPSEQRLVAALLSGELRQGAGRGLATDAVAVAASVPQGQVRRATTLSGDLAEVAVAALTAGGPQQAAAALDAFGLVVGTPLAPMLAQSAPDVAQALERTGPAGVEWKLDGVRVQLHKVAGQVRVWTRSLDDVTDRLPEVVAAVAALDAEQLVLDGEVIALDGSGPLRDRRPLPFQQTGARVATRSAAADVPLTTVLFDVLHVDGRDLLDEPYAARREVLERLAPDLAVPALLGVAPDGPGGAGGAGGSDTERGQEFAASALARGHEGVVVKSLAAPYAMGRRGAAWVKVKPRTTFDLVVLAAEWGHGRRTGYLSNLHLGARDPDGLFGPPGGFVMLGKTFKGMTDELLRTQTDQLQQLATGSSGGVVTVRPEVVVEIAVDGVQTSPRYPAGMALRFARVVRYRPDKSASEADTVDSVRRLHTGDAG